MRQNPTHMAGLEPLGRYFTASAPNQKRVADLTWILTGLRVLWLASVRDACSNKVIGLDSGHHCSKGCPVHLGAVHPAAAGSPASPLRPAPSEPSTMPSPRTCGRTIMVEMIDWPATTFATRAEAQAALLGYIDGWYNLRRIQQGLDGLSPDEYEAA